MKECASTEGGHAEMGGWINQIGQATFCLEGAFANDGQPGPHLFLRAICTCTPSHIAPRTTRQDP